MLRVCVAGDRVRACMYEHIMSVHEICRMGDRVRACMYEHIMIVHEICRMGDRVRACMYEYIMSMKYVECVNMRGIESEHVCVSQS
jgi:hypothetical protein